MDLVVNGVYCGACIVTIEKGLGRQAGVRGARVNLANKRVTVEWNDGALEPPAILERLEALGYPAFPFTAEARRQRRGSGGEAPSALPRRRRVRRDERHAALGLALGGRRERSQFRDPRPVPLALGAGRAALRGLRRHAVLRERRALDPRRARSTWTCRSRSASSSGWRCRVLQTVSHQHGTYFEGAVMLLMFLLAGRLLDQRMRRRTRDYAINLSAMRADRALKLVRRRRSARDADRRDPAGRPRARPPRRADRRRRRGRGRALGGRPEPRDRRDGARRRSRPARRSTPARST